MSIPSGSSAPARPVSVSYTPFTSRRAALTATPVTLLTALAVRYSTWYRLVVLPVRYLFHTLTASITSPIHSTSLRFMV